MQTYYKPGSWNAVCDRTGFKIKASEIREEWNGLRVRARSLDPRHPQDLLRGIPDDPSVPWARPRTFAYITTELLTGRYWEYTGDWQGIHATAWRNDITGEATFGLIQLRSDSFLPIGTVTGVIQIGDSISLSAVITAEIVYGGMIFGQLKYYDPNLDALNTDNAFTFDEYDATGAWLSQGSSTVPANAAYLQIIFKANGLNAAEVSVSAPSLTISRVTESTVAWSGDIPVSTPVGPITDGDAAYTGYDLGE